MRGSLEDPLMVATRGEEAQEFMLRLGPTWGPSPHPSFCHMVCPHLPCPAPDDYRTAWWLTCTAPAQMTPRWCFLPLARLIPHSARARQQPPLQPQLPRSPRLCSSRGPRSLGPVMGSGMGAELQQDICRGKRKKEKKNGPF